MLPYPSRSGGQQRTQLMHRALSELGSVDVLVMTDEPLEPSSAEICEVLKTQYGMTHWLIRRRVWDQWPWRALGGLGDVWATRLAKLLGGASSEFVRDPKIHAVASDLMSRRNYDLVVSRHLEPLALADIATNVPRLVDLDDVPSEIAARKLTSMKPVSAQAWYWRRAATQLRGVEGKMLAGCSHAWVAKEADLKFVTSVPASVVPNIPFTTSDTLAVESCPPAENSRVVLMVGTMGWNPNEKAADRFLTESWPLIREAEPEATFRIVGSGMSEAMRSRWGALEGVMPVGFVNDLHTEYLQAAFAVCPLWEGGGSSIKVLEALRYGRTIVCTPCGARGYEGKLLDGESILVRDDMQSLAEACIALLRDPDSAARMAVRGQRIVSEQYTYDVFRDRVHAAIRGVMAPSGVHDDHAPGVTVGTQEASVNEAADYIDRT